MLMSQLPGERALIDPARIVDVWFPWQHLGGALPRETAYPLYGAILGAGVPRRPALGIHALLGGRIGLRLPAEDLVPALHLRGQELHLAPPGGQGAPARLRLGVPLVEPLRPYPRLQARVSIRFAARGPLRPGRRALAVSPGPAPAIEQAIEERLLALGLQGVPFSVGGRTWTQRIESWHVRIWGLADWASLRLQAEGLGGRRTHGCGLFVADEPRRGGAPRGHRTREDLAWFRGC